MVYVCFIQERDPVLKEKGLFAPVSKDWSIDIYLFVFN